MRINFLNHLRRRRRQSPWPIVVALLVLGSCLALWGMREISLGQRHDDYPPTIDFTWRPLGPTSLLDFEGNLKMHDDYGLDFSTYRLRIVELDKTIDMPIEGMIGRDYESPIRLGFLADKPGVWEHERLTIEISIADDRGQVASINRVIRLRAPEGFGLMTVE